MLLNKILLLSILPIINFSTPAQASNMEDMSAVMKETREILHDQTLKVQKVVGSLDDETLEKLKDDSEFLQAMYTFIKLEDLLEAETMFVQLGAAKHLK